MSVDGRGVPLAKDMRIHVNSSIDRYDKEMPLYMEDLCWGDTSMVLDAFLLVETFHIRAQLAGSSQMKWRCVGQ